MNHTKKESVIIDVREPNEFAESHIKGAINIPVSKFKKEAFEPYQNNVINLICRSGNRAGQVQEKLIKEGFEQVYVTAIQMQDIGQERPKKNIWTVDRQFRMFLGIMLAIFLIGYLLEQSYLIIIPAILSTGLIFTSLIDRCYLRMGIAKLPWNKK